MRKLTIILMFFFFMPVLAHAQLQLSEVMYDSPGTDTGREWVEVYNSTVQDVDLSDWTFFQGGTNHKISSLASSTPAVLKGSSYAIIASDSSKFFIDWPHYTGIIFHSAFSLKNTGETISLSNKGQQVDQYTIDPAIGAQGDGNSLQKLNGLWVGAAPTPGAANRVSQGAVQNPNPESSGTDPSPSTTNNPVVAASTAETQTSSNGTSIVFKQYPVDPQIFCTMSVSNSPVVGVAVKFSGESWGLQKEPLANARYIWNFGDGSTAEGKSAFHTYREEGTYFAVLSVGAGEYSASSNLKIDIVKPQIEISKVLVGEAGFVEVKNGSSQDIDISGFSLRSGGNSFYFPLSSVVVAGQSLRFYQETLGFKPISQVTLFYPNGVQLDAYSEGQNENLGVKVINDPETITASTTNTIRVSKQSKTKTTKVALSSKSKNIVKSNSIGEQSDKPEDALSTSSSSAELVLNEAAAIEANQTGWNHLPWPFIVGGVLIVLIISLLYWKRSQF